MNNYAQNWIRLGSLLKLRFGSDDCDTPFPSALVVWGAKPETIQALDRALPDAWRTR